VKLFFDEVYKKDLSDWDITRINNKLLTLSMRARDSVQWHLQQSKNGGWYIAGYKNRSVTMDGYWSPGISRYEPMYRKADNTVLGNTHFDIGAIADTVDIQIKQDKDGMTLTLYPKGKHFKGHVDVTIDEQGDRYFVSADDRRMYENEKELLYEQL